MNHLLTNILIVAFVIIAILEYEFIIDITKKILKKFRFKEKDSFLDGISEDIAMEMSNLLYEAFIVEGEEPKDYNLAKKLNSRILERIREIEGDNRNPAIIYISSETGILLKEYMHINTVREPGNVFIDRLYGLDIIYDNSVKVFDFRII